LHLEIANTQIHFDSPQCLRKYLATLDAVDVDYYACINRAKGLTKVIILPLDENGAMHIGFTVEEFEELKTVIRNYLSRNSKKQFFCKGIMFNGVKERFCLN
jgi:hypothetical protein